MGGGLGLAISHADPAGSRPNIILIMVDDMGWSDIGCYGGEVDTPNLNRLAREGLRFTQFYNNAKCTTTRASLLTGLYPRRRGGLLKQNMVTLGEALHRAGYQTSLTGKWHLGSGETTHPYHRGFDEYYGLLDGCCNYFDPSRRDPPYKGGKVRVFGHNDERITKFPDDYYTTDAFTDHAIATLKRFAARREPFFLHLCYNAPHYPIQAKPKDIAKYRGKFLMGWEAMRRARYQRQIALGLFDPKTWALSATDSRAYPWETANHEFEDLRMAVYAAMIDCVDQNLGRLLCALDEAGAHDNTVIFFLSDNGGCSEEPGGRDPAKRHPGPKDDYVAVGPAWGWAQNAPFRRYKSWVHEGGISTPLIVWYPGVVKPNSLTDQPGHIIDFMPTFLELAGTNYPSRYNGHDILPAEGHSLLPILEGKIRKEPEYLAWEWSGNRAYRQGRWKVVWDSLVKHWELYDLDSDRTETKNLAAQHPDLTRKLSEAWFAWAKESGAPGGSAKN
jgi:arylsulfatase A-like enzyme